MPRPRPALLVTALVAALVVEPAWSAAPTVNDLFAMRLQNSANSSDRATGDILFWGANSVVPSSTSWGFARQCPTGATCSSGDDPDFVRQALFFRPFTLHPDQYFASRPYDPSLTKPWTLLVSGDPSFATELTVKNTPAVGAVELMPFVQSLTVSGAGITPTVNWVLPAGGPGVSEVRLRVFDNSHPVLATSRSPAFQSSFQQGDYIFDQVLSPAVTSFTLPASWITPGGASRSLQFGDRYSIAVTLDHQRSNGSVDSRSQSFFDFTPINLPGIANIALPTVVPVPTTSGLFAGPVYSFDVAHVSPTEITFIDPLVATGYVFMTGAGDPNFRSVTIPTDVGDHLYDVYTWDGTQWTLARQNLGVNEEFDFTTHGAAAGVDRFKIAGIEESAGLSPTDVTAFVTGLGFVAEGGFTGTMQPIVTSVPEPRIFAMLLAGVGLVGLAARRQRARV